MRSGMRWLRSKNCCDASLHQMANSLRSMKAVLRHNSLDFRVKLWTRQDLVVCIDLIDCVSECDFLGIRCLVVIVVRKWWEQAAWYHVNERFNDYYQLWFIDFVKALGYSMQHGMPKEAASLNLYRNSELIFCYFKHKNKPLYSIHSTKYDLQSWLPHTWRVSIYIFRLSGFFYGLYERISCNGFVDEYEIKLSALRTQEAELMNIWKARCHRQHPWVPSN